MPFVGRPTRSAVSFAQITPTDLANPRSHILSNPGYWAILQKKYENLLEIKKGKGKLARANHLGFMKVTVFEHHIQP